MNNSMGKPGDLGSIVSRRPKFCKRCKGRMIWLNTGVYRCQKCGLEEMDDFGKIKKFLEENGPLPMGVIASQTGVSLEVIDEYLKQGKVEISDNSTFFLKCESCGTFIKSGSLCVDCAKDSAGKIRKEMLQQIGDKARISDEMKGKMHYLHQSHSRNR